MSTIVTTELACGATLVTESIPEMSSVALTFLLGAGSSTDAADSDGSAAILSELVFRGAGGRSSREHSDALDRCGVQRGSQVQTHHLKLDATLLGDRLADALPLLTDMVIRPALPGEAIDAVRSLCLQSLDALDDEPQRRVMLRLRERHIVPPFNRHGYGDPSVLRTIGRDRLVTEWKTRCRPEGAIITAAGALDHDDLARRLDQLLDGWSGPAAEATPEGATSRGHHTDLQETAQVHIAVACDAPPERDPSSLPERLAVAVLSGSTSGRLFTEVRQKRSLCYTVGASYRASRDRGLIALYAGTTPERAEETLRVCLAEIERMAEGVTDAEFRRAVVGLKSHLIMQGESTPARADALAYDQFRLGRARSLAEIAAAIDGATLDGLNDYLRTRRFDPATVVSIGPVALTAEVAS